MITHEVTCDICERELNIVQIITCPKANMAYHASHLEGDKCPICGQVHDAQGVKDARKK